MTQAMQGACKSPEKINLSEFLPSADALACLPAESAKRLHVLPVAIIAEEAARVLLMACADITDTAQHERICRHIGTAYEPRFVESYGGSLMPVISQCYEPRPSLEEFLRLATEREYSDSATAHVPDFSVEFVNSLLVHAVDRGASDIHFSPESASVQIRLRVDGVLISFTSVAKALLGSLLVRIKIMSSLDIAETRYPQDGQFRRLISGRNVDFRVSTFPTVDGENTVLRLIDGHRRRYSINSLKLPTLIEKNLRSIVARPDGLIVVCGPTGAGKSTTLFALLEMIDKVSRSVMTLEDPVEHRLAGIRQTSIDASRQWGYPQALRALLRQDPDVLLIGEIRDADSCSMALRAVSTGHQVMTTVHAASAHMALHRLRELDAGGGALALGLVAIIAQRLVRQVCPDCYASQVPCRFCHGTGYSGRQVIMELLEITDDIKELLAHGADIANIRRKSEVEGFVDLREHAMQLVKAGCTTHEEVERVLGDQ